MVMDFLKLAILGIPSAESEIQTLLLPYQFRIAPVLEE
jgi:hypothetical protein